MKKVFNFRNYLNYAIVFCVLGLCQDFVYAENGISHQVDNAVHELEMGGEDVKIDVLDAKNKDIYEVLELLAQKGRLNIITGQDVQGKITIFLKDVFARDALRIILDTNGLAYSEETGIIRVLTAKGFEERYGYPFTQKVQTKMVPILHADANEIMEVLNEMKSESGRIIFNDQTQTFVLIDLPKKIPAMEAYIKKMDVPIDHMTIVLKFKDPEKTAEAVKSLLSVKGKIEIDQEKKSLTVTDMRTKLIDIKKRIEEYDQVDKNVKFETKILQIILNDEHTRGVDWEAIVSDYKSLEFLGMKNSIEGKNGMISLGTISGEDYSVLLAALETVGDISTLGELNSTASGEESAIISINGLDAVDMSDQRTKFETKDQKEDLRFYLKTLGDTKETIDVNIKPVVFSLDEKAINIAVKNGSTIVIGGLFKNVTVNTESRIPLISDIPLIRDVPFEEIPFLGFAFRNQNKTLRKTEIIVFVTAKTIDAKIDDSAL
ncbi:MAG: hypothetical protein KBD53_00975 [Candidatus Omnitrophica bacterium]|nr:hypothetical protein [Candidatus Omnitrophota bacterium]